MLWGREGNGEGRGRQDEERGREGEGKGRVERGHLRFLPGLTPMLLNTIINMNKVKYSTGRYTHLSIVCPYQLAMFTRYIR